MRRWLVAVFTLHLFVSVSAFAFGASPGPAALHSPAAAQILQAALHVPSVEPAQADGVHGASPANEHGAIDAQADWPECLDVPVRADRHGVHARTPAPPPATDLTQPVLDGPQRPPRGLPTHA